MQTYGKAAPRIGTVAPGTKRGLIDKAMRPAKPAPVRAPVAPRKVKY